MWRIFSVLFAFLSAFAVVAQTNLQEIQDNPAKAGGVYYAYPVKETKNTPPPKGYKPFYISHFGRHGSRYLIFIESLKENNPQLVITRESSNRHIAYLNYHSSESGKYSSEQGEWYLDFKKFRDEKTNPTRLIKSLFSDSLYVRRNIDEKEFMTSLYWIAVDMQNMETKISFFDLFLPEELFDIWQIYNYNFYATNSSYPPAQGLHVDNAKNCWQIF